MQEIQLKKQEYIDFGEGIKITDKYEISAIYGDIFVVKDNKDKFGLISLSSKLLNTQVIVSPQYEDIKPFNKDLFMAIKLENGRKKEILINKDGNIYFENNDLDYQIKHIFRDGQVLIYDCNKGHYVCGKEVKRISSADDWDSSQTRIIDDNNVLINLISADKENNCFIYKHTTNECRKLDINYDYVSEFQYGVARIKLNGKWGIIDKDGNAVIGPIYNHIDLFKNGVSVFNRNNEYGLITTSGEVTLNASYRHISLFNNKTALLYTHTFNNRLTDIYGKNLIEFLPYTIMDYLKDDYYLFWDNQETFNEGILRIDGGIVVKPEHRYIQVSNDDVLEYDNELECDNENPNYNTQGLINLQGKKIYEVKGTEGSSLNFNLKDGLIAIESSLNHRLKSLITDKGEMVIPFMELNNLHIVNSNYVVINNTLYDINNFKKIYKLIINYKDNTFERFFTTEEEREKIVKFYKSKKLKFLWNMKKHLEEINEANKKVTRYNIYQEASNDVLGSIVKQLTYTSQFEEKR